MKFSLPMELLPSNRWPRNIHAHEDMRKKQQRDVAVCMPWQVKGGFSHRGWHACVVKLTRIGSGTLDDDNLRTSFKYVRDIIAKSLLGGRNGQMDSDARIAWRYAQRNGPAYAVEIEIDPVTAEQLEGVGDHV